MQKSNRAFKEMRQADNDSCFEIVLTGRNRPEFLERVLRVIRYRGFRVQSLQGAITEINTVSLSISLSASVRESGFLLPQLHRLPDIHSVTLK